jgi:glutathione S-transferase
VKLFFSPNSPYARKCRVVILEKGLQDKVELVSVMPSDNPPELVAANPLGTVPTLVIDNGKSLCESPVICEYLDSLSDKNPLFPTDKSERFDALALAALADGIMDAAVACVMEGRRPEEKRYQVWVERKENAVKRTIAKISEFNLDTKIWHIGAINTAIALSYVDFRLPHLNWRDNNKNLSNWLDFNNKKQSMLATAPAA